MGDLQDQIAIVGMSGRFPGAPDLDAFWKNLRDGVESITFFTPEELQRQRIDRARLNNPNLVPAKSHLDGQELFDAGFFGYSPQEAETIDPQQRIFLECAWEAMEHAGYVPDTFAGPIGVFAGSQQNLYLWFNLLARPEFLDRTGLLRTIITNGADYLAPRVAYKLGLTGPSATVQSACSTSLVAVHLACQSLLNFEADLALAGGVSLNVAPFLGYNYEAGGLFSRDGHTRTFDARAGGTCFGEGAGVIVLKRLEEAIEDRDTIHAIVRASAVNNDGAAKAGFTALGMTGQATVIHQALENAGIGADTISYVEAHGTATDLGDAIEVKALTTAFRHSTSANGYCAIGSVKSNIGHLTAAAGIAGLLKTVLAMQHREIPPTLHVERPNPNIDFASTPFVVNTALRPWTSKGPRRAGINAFGIGGTNAHVILEEAPALPPSASGRPRHALVLSARSESALELARARLAAHLRAHPEQSLADVAWTLATGRRQFRCRHAVVAGTREEAIEAFEATHDAGWTDTPRSAGQPVVFLFQEYDVAGVAALAREVASIGKGGADEIARLAARARALVNVDVTMLLEGRQADGEQVTAQVRVASVVVQLAFARVLMRWGVTPTAMAGVGAGRQVADCLNGVITDDQAMGRAAAAGTVAQDAPACDVMLETLLAPGDRMAVVAGPGGSIGERLENHPSRALWLGPDDRRRLIATPNPVDALARAWVHGAEVDWAAFREGEPRRRVPLPTYPFERQRYWSEVYAGPPDMPTTPAVTVTTDDLADWFTTGVWRESTRPVAAPDAAATWLVFADGQGIADGLRVALGETGRTVVTVTPGAAFSPTGERVYTVRRDAAEDYQSLVAHLRGADLAPARIVHLWALDADGQRGATAQVASVAGITEAMASDEHLRGASVLVVTCDAVQVLSEGASHPEGLAVLGPLRRGAGGAAAMRVRCVDLERGRVGRERGALAARLIAESDVADESDLVAWRRGRRWVAGREAVRLAAPGVARLIPQGTWCALTGATHGPGLAIAEALARRERPQLLLVEPMRLPAREAWASHVAAHGEDDRVSRAIRAALRLEALGATVAIAAVPTSCGGDVSVLIHAEPLSQSPDRSSLDAAMAQARALVDDVPEAAVFLCAWREAQRGIGSSAETSALHVFLDALSASAPASRPGRVMTVAWDRFRDPFDTRVGIDGERAVDALARVANLDVSHVTVAPARDGAFLETAGTDRRLSGATAEVSGPTAEQGSGARHRRPSLDTPYVEPATATERDVAAIWAELLGLDRVGVDDHFIELGGDSLLATQIVARVRSRFQVDLALRDVMDQPTVRRMAAAISAQVIGGSTTVRDLVLALDQMSDEEAAARLLALQQDSHGDR